MKHNIMVCVTRPQTCERLISRGMERSRDSEIHIVHCVETGRNFLGSAFEGDAVEYLFTAAQLAGAELILLRVNDIDDALVDYAEKNGIDMIIMGASPANLDHDSIVTRLQRRLPAVEFDIVG